MKLDVMLVLMLCCFVPVSVEHEWTLWAVVASVFGAFLAGKVVA
jgi:hypothetical protein